MFRTFLSNGQVPPEVMFFLVAPVVLLIYFFAVWDSHRKEVQGKVVDSQIGFKVALAAFGFLGLMLCLANLHLFVTILLTFKFKKILQPIPGILVGGGVLFLLVQKVLPQTNYKTETKVFRLTAGAVAIFAGSWFVLFLHHMLTGLFGWQGWSHLAYHLAGVLVYAPFALFSALFLARAVGASGVADSLQSVVNQVPLGQKRASTDTDPTAKPVAVAPASAAPASPAAAPSPGGPAFVNPQKPVAPAPAYSAPAATPPTQPPAPSSYPGSSTGGSGTGTGS